MKKLSFFSIPRNKTRKETIEVIKTHSLQMGENLLKNLKGVRINLESVQKSCRKNRKTQTQTQTLFSNPQKQRVLDHTPRHRSLIGKGG